MTAIRPFALLKQVAAVPFHFVRHQWKHQTISEPQKHAFGPHPRQYLMFWLPPKGLPERRSVVVFYHGGGWRLGWPNQFPTVADWFLRQGFPVALPAYRLCPRFAYPDMREDLNLAFQKIRELMKINHLSQKKLLVGGMSAGATLAAHLVFNQQELARLSVNQDVFSGFLSCGGPLDLNQMPNLPPLRRFAGGAPGSAAFISANPMTWLAHNEHLPVMLVHGTADAIVPYSISSSFFERYPGAKTLFSIPGGSHLDSLGFALNDQKAANAVSEWLDGH